MYHAGVPTGDAVFENGRTTFSNEPSISGSSTAHSASSPPRNPSQLYGRGRAKALSAAFCLGARGAAIVHCPQGIIPVELL